MAMALLNCCPTDMSRDWAATQDSFQARAHFLHVKCPRLPEAAEVWASAPTKGCWEKSLETAQDYRPGAGALEANSLLNGSLSKGQRKKKILTKWPVFPGPESGDAVGQGLGPD